MHPTADATTLEEVTTIVRRLCLEDFLNYEPADYDGDYDVATHLIENCAAAMPSPERVVLEWCVPILRSRPDLLHMMPDRHDGTVAHAILFAIRAAVFDEIADEINDRAIELGLVARPGSGPGR